MVQENTNPEEQKPDSSLFAQMSSISPPRETGGGGDGGGDNGGELNGDGNHSDDGGTIEDRMNSARKKSDIQIVIEKLFPEFPIKWLNALLVARIFPDSFNYLFSMCVKELVRTTNMRVGEAIAYVNAVLTIAIDGESRIDAIHIVGRGAEMEENKSKTGMMVP